MAKQQHPGTPSGAPGNTLKGSIYLFLAALIWGFAFVAQRLGMEYVGPFTFNGVRNLIGAIVLLPLIYVRSKLQPGTRGDTSEGALQHNDPTPSASPSSLLLRGGVVCGIFLCIAGNLQQVGIKYTTVGKAGFITAMYIVMVPLLGIFLKRRVGWKIWISVALAVVGLYLLSMADSLALDKGDTYVLLSAVAFAFQITAIDHYSKLVDGVKLAWLEFLVCGILSMGIALATETIAWESLKLAALPILYAGILSCGVAYTLQILGQRELKPSLAALIMSFESVISAIGGWLILGQALSLRELAGCAVIFIAIILAQMPEPGRRA